MARCIPGIEYFGWRHRKDPFKIYSVRRRNLDDISETVRKEVDVDVEEIRGKV